MSCLGFASEIDWSATGQMISGLGTWFGGGALLWATIKGRESLADWRSQKLLDREIAIAEDVLTAAYEARSAIKSTRVRLLQGAEVDRATQQLKSSQSAPEIEDGLVTAQTLMNRLDGKIYDLLFAVLPKAKAVLGNDVSEKIGAIANIWTETAIDIQLMAHHVGNAAVNHKQAFYGTGENSASAKLDRIVADLEGLVLPILRPSSKSN